MTGNKGRYIVFEGCEGVGKSTHIGLLEDYLSERGIEYVFTREPGGTPVAESIRPLMLNPKNGGIDDETIFLLMSAARSDLFKTIISPALSVGKVVVSDRSMYSSVAYQGYGSRVDLDFIRTCNKFSTMGIRPNLLIILDDPNFLGMGRLLTKEFGEKDVMESRNIEFHKRVREGFLKIAEENPDIAAVIPYIENGQEEMQKQIRGLASKVLQ